MGSAEFFGILEKLFKEIFFAVLLGASKTRGVFARKSP